MCGFWCCHDSRRGQTFGFGIALGFWHWQEHSLAIVEYEFFETLQKHVQLKDTKAQGRVVNEEGWRSIQSAPDLPMADFGVIWPCCGSRMADYD